jgi:hypothetical protein
MTMFGVAKIEKMLATENVGLLAIQIVSPCAVMISINSEDMQNHSERRLPRPEWLMKIC